VTGVARWSLILATVAACGRAPTPVSAPVVGDAPHATHVVVVTSSTTTSSSMRSVTVATGSVSALATVGFDAAVVAGHHDDRLFVLSTAWDGGPQYGPTTLSVRDSSSLSELAQVTVSSPIRYNGGQGPAPLMVTRDDEYVVVYHYEVTGDSRARYWLSVHATANGKERIQVDLGSCGAAFLTQGGDPNVLYVTCHAGYIQIVHLDSGKLGSKINLPFNLNTGSPGWTEVAGAAVSADGTRYVAVTRNLGVFSMDLRSDKTRIWSQWQTSGSVVAFDQLALSDDGTRLWTALEQPSTLVALNLSTGTRQDMPVPRIRGLTGAGGTAFYESAGHIRDTSGTVNLDLGEAVSRSRWVRLVAA